MSTYAQLEDLEAWSGEPISPAQAHQMQEWLDEAEVLLEVAGGVLADRVTAGFTTTARLKTAVVGMVRRVVDDQARARALASQASTTGEERAAARTRLTVTRRERSLLGLSSAASSMDLSEADPQLWWPTRRTWPLGLYQGQVIPLA